MIAIEEDGFHLIVDGKINGQDASFLIDTGASRTVFDSSWIQMLYPVEALAGNEKMSVGLGTSTMPSFVATIDSISFGQITIKDYQAVALDLSHLLETYKILGLPVVVGVLGSDLLRQFNAVIDFGKKQLKLYSGRRILTNGN